jgi:hypothetical protein
VAPRVTSLLDLLRLLEDDPVAPAASRPSISG